MNAHCAVQRLRRLAADRTAQVRTLRSADLEREVRPTQTAGRAHVFVADVDPAEECDLVVDQQQLAVVAAEAAEQQRTQAVVDADLAATRAQLRRDRIAGTR